jgi:prophage DNA circulation protein
MSCTPWTDQLQRASFKGVDFEVDSLDTTEGWDVVVREYPFQDMPTAQPMGETTNEYKISAYVIGDDYATKRDNLAKALRGEGLLSHPTLGFIRVWVNGPFTYREQIVDERNVARFDVTFVKAEERRYPQIGINFRFKILDDIRDAINTANAWLGATLSFVGSGFIRNTALGQIDEIITAAEELVLTLHGGKDSFYEVSRYIKSLGNRIENLLGTPDALGSALSKAFVLPNFASSNDALAGFNAFYAHVNDGFSVSQSPVNTTPSRLRETENTKALSAYVQVVMTLNACACLQDVRFESYHDALRTRQLVHAQFKKILADDHNYALHVALRQMHAAMLADLTERSQSYGRLSTYVPSDVQSLTYISYRLYGTTDYDEELWRNNPHVKHPLLVPAGQELMVIHHG